MIVGSSEEVRLPADESPDSALIEGRLLGERASGQAEPDGEGEAVRLEDLLAERAREVQSLRNELARARKLLREASVHFEEAAELASATAPSELAAQRDRAAARALEAEVARAELAFRMDELLGHVATAVGDLRAPSDDTLELTCARLSGTARGLRAALAEAEEARDVARARLMLIEQDFDQHVEHERTLARALSESREQTEIELSRARSLAIELARVPSPVELESLRGERSGLRARLAEQELAFERRNGPVSNAEAAPIRELNSKLEHEIENRREAQSQLARSAAEQIVLREELTRVQAELSEWRQRLEQGRAVDSTRLDAAEAERDSAKRESAAKREWAARMAESLRDSRALLRELTAALDRAGSVPAGTSIEASEDGSIPPGPRSSVPPGIEALEGLEERVTLRDQRITDLSAQLARDRGRIAAATQALADLQARASRGEAPTRAELDHVLAQLVPR